MNDIKYIGNMGGTFLEVDEIKRNLLLFDKIVINSNSLGVITNSQEYNEIASLGCISTIQDVIKELNPSESKRQQLAQMEFEFKSRMNLVSDEIIRDGLKISKELLELSITDKEKLSSRIREILTQQKLILESFVLLEANMLNTFENNIKAVPVITVPTQEPRTYVLSNETKYMYFFLEEFPLISHNVNIHEILNFKDQTNKYLNRLRAHITSISNKDCKISDYHAEFRENLENYKEAIITNRRLIEKKKLAILVSGSIDLFNNIFSLMKIPWKVSDVGNSMVKMLEAEIQLYELDSKIKGNEVAYIFYANNHFH